MIHGLMDLLRLASPGQSRCQLAGRSEESPALGLDCISVDTSLVEGHE
ncbi:unnamed protein product [Musa acuminata subsp. malaccensis]|uniref:(wild Malaysian banana) hypothetical protein n=1 Tax=Musa acuminata subsp. malaccensis TaxID=214687 RepID=A0A804KFZ4_MUSAM|nr:unnamed protein product [Musa acuminata subsp. malaccensis]